MVRTRSPFSLQPQPTACVPCGTHPTDGFKGRLKKRSRRLFHLPCDKRLPGKFLPLRFRAFFFRRPATPESAVTRSLPRGGGLGRGHSQNGGNLSQYLNPPNTSLAACCPLSSSLPRGERMGWLLGLRVLQGKQVVQTAFYFSDDLYKCSIQSACTLLFSII